MRHGASRGTRWITAAVAVAALTTTLGALPPLKPLDATGRVTYFVAEGEPDSTYKPADRQLAVWALGAWQRALNGALRFTAAPQAQALVHVFWVGAQTGQYGETRPIVVNGHGGAAAYIRPDTSALGPDIAALARNDALFRDTIVYLTCVHELGHALGLPHTASFDDVMYAFGYGGDIPQFFMRYRRQLKTRADIAGVSGLSPGDVAAARTLYPH
jgi:hypothetical protein